MSAPGVCSVVQQPLDDGEESGSSRARDLTLFNVRHFTKSALNVEAFTGNRVALGVTCVLVLLQLAFTYAPPLQQVFASEGLGWASWTVIIVLGIAKFLAVEAEKAFRRHRGVRRL